VRRNSRTVSVPAYAKLNLTLDVKERRSDGYHNIESVMQSISLRDIIRITVSEGDGTFIKSTEPHIPQDERNTAFKAAKLFRLECGGLGRVDIVINKRIPVGSGLGGGSADAAAVLIGLNHLTGSGLSLDRLAALGAFVGSDVPFCVKCGTQLATGRGEILSVLPDLPECRIVIVKPRFSVSTAELYAAADSIGEISQPDKRYFIDALLSGSLKFASPLVYNVFEDLLPPYRKTEICAIKRLLVECGALSASMTGTGSAVFGIFDALKPAQLAADTIRRGSRETFLVRPQRFAPEPIDKSKK